MARADEVPPETESSAPLTIKPIRFEPIDLSPQQKVRIVALTTFGIAWFFWLGAVLGSYLNVVVYRMPLGLNTVAPVSRCPKCQTAIRPRDNIPILSWLLLRGRCRACGEPISSRYVIVESIMGLLFVLLLCFDVLSGGWYLPDHLRSMSRGLPVIEHFLQPRLLGLYFYHAALVWFLTGSVLFLIDGNRVPRKFILAGLLIAIVPPLIWPTLTPVFRS
jgi:leader peptidase (prepilin peptidase)/N-methyltransferase